MRLITKRTSQRGVTLVELVIVLALLIVITTLIISLTTALNGLVKVNERLYQSIEDLTISRNYIENWFYSFDEKDNIYSIDNVRQLTLYFTETANELSLFEYQYMDWYHPIPDVPVLYKKLPPTHPL